MPPRITSFTSSVACDVSCQHADPCYSSGKVGPLSPSSDEPPAIQGTRSNSVSFNEVVKAKKTIHIADFTAEEIRCYWYRDEDYEVMKRDLRFEVNLLENDCIIEKPWSKSTMTHSARGLEMYSSTTVGRARREIKSQALHIVLEEQRLQREEGSYDPEFIAEIYSAVTKVASQIAIAAAC